MGTQIEFFETFKKRDERKEEESYTYNTTTTCIAEEE